MNFHFLDFQTVINVGCCMCYCCIIICLLLLTFFYLFFTIDHNPMLGYHTGGLVGSLQPSIHNCLSVATNIVAKANVVGTNLYLLWMLSW